MRAMRLLIYIVLTIMAAACSGRGSRTPLLDEAERLMPSDPSAALAQLNTMDLSRMDDSATMARWALLYSEAMVATGQHAPTDTIVNIAIDYYSNHRMAGHARRASSLKALMADTCAAGHDRLAESLYLQKEREYWLYRERTEGRQRMAALLVLIAVAIGIIMWQRQRIRLQDARHSLLVGEAAALRADMLRHRKERSLADGRLAGMLAERFAMVDELCATYFESQGTKAERKAVAEKVKAHIEAIKTDSGIFAGMEQSVDLCLDGMATRLRQEWTDIRPDEYRLMIYLACGLSSRSIALLIGESVPTVYKRKSRLKERVNRAGLPHSAQFLSVF